MKNWIKNESLLYAVIVTSIVALLLFFATGQDGLGQVVSVNDHTYIELEVVEVDEHGVMFYDNDAEFEPNIFMAHEDLQDPSIKSKNKFQRFEVGEIVTGEFDSEGWVLFAVAK